MSSPFTIDADGVKSWKPEPGDSYLVCGKTVDGKRFRQTWPTWFWANGINMYEGRKYLVRGGKRHLICRVTS